MLYNKKEKVKFLYQFKIKPAIESIRRWGNKYITLMFVPHSEKRVISFHISNFALSFFVFLVISIVTISIFSAQKSSLIEKKVEKLKQADKNKKFQVYYFKRLVREIDNTLDKSLPDLEEIYSIFGTPKDQIENLWKTTENEQGILTKLKRITNKKEIIYPPEYYEMDSVINKVIFSTRVISTIERFVSMHKDMVYNVPSIWPINGGFLTSRYGYRRSPFFGTIDFHPGIDIASPPGTPIYATADGIVEDVGYGGGYGLRVKIRHKYGHYTIYAHCSKIYVKKGDKVKRGQLIAAVGSTGLSTGPHLHYEIRIGKKTVNPLPYCIWYK